jgi:hypothetical protein
MEIMMRRVGALDEARVTGTESHLTERAVPLSLGSRGNSPRVTHFF